MTKTQLVNALARRLKDHSPEDLRIVVSGILGALVSRLARGGRIEIRGFGTFEISHRPARVGRNPKTGAQVQIPARPLPQFRAGKEFRERLNRAASAVAAKDSGAPSGGAGKDPGAPPPA